MSRTKYITSGGLAFSENRDMEKLRRYSLQGWHVRDFKFMGYTLEKGESADYIYNIDYRTLDKKEEEEYFDFFLSAGWSHVVSQGNIHLFRADPETKPIYSDRSTSVEKYKTSSKLLTSLAIPMALITVLLWVGAWLSSGTLESILFVAAIILTALTIPALWTMMTAYSNKWKVEGKNNLANLMKAIPILLLITLVIALLVVNGQGDKGSIFIYMAIGAIAFPTAIWIIMSVYHKLRKE